MLNKELKETIKNYRHSLHKIPEVGFKEYKTQAFLNDILVNLGYEIEIVANTGLVAFKKGQIDRTIAFRTDIDALPVLEKTDVPFISEHVGYMHACGHDGHMSILLGFASLIANMDIKKNVLLIFQPAEEGPGGAEVIIKAGILKKYKVEKIFGLHVFPEIPEGKVGLTPGVLMGQVGEIDIKIVGQSAHGAMPHNGIDGILVAANLIQSYQSIISRNIDPTEGAVLTLGKISGGEARNIICGSVELNGTIRAFKEEIYNTIKKRIQEINIGLEMMYNVKIITTIRDMYPALVNEYDCFIMMKKILKSDEIIEMKPLMIAEDFSYYLKEVPGYFFMLGVKNAELGYVHPLHSCYFNFRDEILFHGVDIYLRIAKELEII